jgi:hypothetical protein
MVVYGQIIIMNPILTIDQTSKYILCTITPDNTKKLIKPLNLVVVVDKSGSMSGPKINKLRHALYELVEKMATDDILTLISYDNDVTFHFSYKCLPDNISVIKSEINTLYAVGETNIYSAIKSAYKYFDTNYHSESINQIFFFSDGCPTTGKITLPKDICTFQSLLSNRLRKYGKHILFTCYGLGDDYDGYFMRQLSKQGGGDFYYIKSSENISECITDGLRVSHNITSKCNFIEIQCWSPTTIILHSTNGYELEYQYLIQDENKHLLNRYKVQLGSIYDSPITILFELVNNNLKSSSTIKDVCDENLGSIKLNADNNIKVYYINSVCRDDSLLEIYHKMSLIVHQIEQAIKNVSKSEMKRILDILENIENKGDLPQNIKKLIYKYYAIINSYLVMADVVPDSVRRSSSCASNVDDLYTTSSKTPSIGMTPIKPDMEPPRPERNPKRHLLRRN